MAIAKSSVTTATNTGSSATISVTTSESPTTTQVGDLVVVMHFNDFYTLANMPTPTATGSPTLSNIVDADGGTNQAHIRTWWYVANTSGAQTVSVTETGAHDEEKFMAVYVLTGADTASPIDGTASNISTSQQFNQVCNSITTTNTDSVAFQGLAAGTGIAAPSYTPPGGTTKDYDIRTGGGSAGGGTAQLVASGATGTFTWTMPPGGTPYVSVTFGIKTASGSVTVAQGTKSTNRHPGRGPRQTTNFRSARSTTGVGNTVNVDGTLAVTANRTATASVDHKVSGSLTVTANRTGTAAVTHTVSGSLTVTVNRTSAAAVTHTVSGTRPITVGLSGTAAVTHTVSGTRVTTVNRTATAAVTHNVSGSLTVTANRTGTVAIIHTVSGTLVVTVNRTATAAVGAVGSRPTTVVLVATAAVVHTVNGTLVVVVNRTATGDTGGGSSYLFLPFF